MSGKIKNLWKDRANQSRYAHWLFRYSRPYFWKIAGMTSLGFVRSGITILMTLVTKKIIDDATGGTKDSLLTLVLIYFGMIILIQVISIITSLASTMLNEKFSFGIRKQLYDKILRSCWLPVADYHTGDLMTRMTTDATNISDGIVVTIPQIIELFIELIMVFFTLFHFSKLLACFALIIAPVAAVMTFWLGKKLKKLTVKVQETEAAYRGFMQESLANILIMKAFSNEQYASDRLTEFRDNRFYWVFKKTKMGQISSTAMSFSFQLGYIVAFAYGALQVAARTITYGTMSVFMTLVNRVQVPVLQLAQQIPRIVSILASAGRIIELQEIADEERTKTQLTGPVGVKAEHITFGYNDDVVINDATFEIKPGEAVAIVGESGIGKTTLVRLVLSFVKPDSGTIGFCDGTGRFEQANASTREFISYVPQGNTLFSGTIRENIRMGRLDATEEEMIEALKMASGYEFVSNLEKGLDTVIGEKGHGLSEGQAQRIAIARAFVRKTPFLILDEATSALDEDTELKVLSGLMKLDPKPTCLIITHRRSILKYCSRELHIERSRISEEELVGGGNI